VVSNYCGKILSAGKQCGKSHQIISRSVFPAEEISPQYLLQKNISRTVFRQIKFSRSGFKPLRENFICRKTVWVITAGNISLQKILRENTTGKFLLRETTTGKILQTGSTARNHYGKYFSAGNTA